MYIYGTSDNDQTAYDRGKIGDFTRELNPNVKWTWNSGGTEFVYPTGPVFVRGGCYYYNEDEKASIFTYGRSNGFNGSVYSFRPVILLFNGSE